MGRMEGKDQGSIKSGFGAWLDTVAASGQPSGPVDGKIACLAGTATKRLSGCEQNLSFFPALPCPNLVYIEARRSCPGHEKVTIPRRPNSTMHRALSTHCHGWLAMDLPQHSPRAALSLVMSLNARVRTS